MEALSKDELLRILAAARAGRERDWLMFLVAFGHGLRRSEVVALTPDNIHDGLLEVQRRKGSKRTVQPLLVHENPLLNERPALIEYVSKMHANQLVFPISDRHLARLFSHYCRLAEVPKHKRHPHVLKHTCAMQVIGVAGIEKTKQWLGHKSGASTLEYLKVTDEEAAPAILAALRD